MASEWRWTDKIGEAVVRQEWNNEVTESTKNIYIGNCFMIFLNEWTSEDGVNKYSLFTFFADEKHAKRCLGLEKDYDTRNMLDDEHTKLIKLRLNKKKCKTTMIKKIVGIFSQAFDNLEFEIYIEENKND